MHETAVMVRAGLDGGEERKKVRRQEEMEERQTKVWIARYWLETGGDYAMPSIP